MVTSTQYPSGDIALIYRSPSVICEIISAKDMLQKVSHDKSRYNPSINEYGRILVLYNLCRLELLLSDCDNLD